MNEYHDYLPRCRKFSIVRRDRLILSKVCDTPSRWSGSGEVRVITPQREAAMAAIDELPTVRRFPFPYRGAVSISNDCEFLSWDAFLDLYRLLNTRRGFDLETSSSAFFYATHALCHSSFSYFNSREGQLHRTLRDA